MTEERNLGEAPGEPRVECPCWGPEGEGVAEYVNKVYDNKFNYLRL